MQVASHEAEKGDIRVREKTLKVQHAEIEAELADCMKQIVTLTQQRDTALTASTTLEDSLAYSQSCTRSAQESVLRLKEELESTRLAMVKQARTCAELQEAQFRKPLKDRQQQHLVHRSLDMSWILPRNLHNVDQPPSQHVMASNLKHQAHEDAGHVIFEAYQDGPGLEIEQLELSKQIERAPGSQCLVKETHLHSPMTKKGVLSLD